MGTTEQTEELTKKFYDEVCSTLNMDQLSSEEAWINYIQTKNNFTLEVQNKLNIFSIYSVMNYTFLEGAKILFELNYP